MRRLRCKRRGNKRSRVIREISFSFGNVDSFYCSMVKLLNIFFIWQN